MSQRSWLTLPQLPIAPMLSLLTFFYPLSVTTSYWTKLPLTPESQIIWCPNIPQQPLSTFYLLGLPQALPSLSEISAVCDVTLMVLKLGKHWPQILWDFCSLSLSLSLSLPLPLSLTLSILFKCHSDHGYHCLHIISMASTSYHVGCI